MGGGGGGGERARDRQRQRQRQRNRQTDRQTVRDRERDTERERDRERERETETERQRERGNRNRGCIPYIPSNCFYFSPFLAGREMCVVKLPSWRNHRLAKQSCVIAWTLPVLWFWLFCLRVDVTVTK